MTFNSSKTDVSLCIISKNFFLCTVVYPIVSI